MKRKSLLWRCRRGRLELDLLLLTYLEHSYEQGDEAEQAAFERLLMLSDEVLDHLLIGRSRCEDPRQDALVEKIRAFARSGA